MVSARSLQLFLFINGILLTGGSLEYWLFLELQRSYSFVFLISVLKNLFFIYIIEYLNKRRGYIHEGDRDIQYIESSYYILQAGLLEAAGHWIVPKYDIPLSTELLLFVPKSFAFELTFDFFHYWAHRINHTPVLYKYIHKLHHSEDYIHTGSTFRHTFLDLVTTNTIPIFLAASIVPTSEHFIFIFFWYKTIGEIGGHIGKRNGGSSFQQCIWLPRYLSIALTSSDHTLHHDVSIKNYSKRFSLWDKVFGSYQPASETFSETNLEH